MPRSSDRRGLPGGRALYRSKQDSYASQGFEDDTRQSQFGGLAMLYLIGNQSIPTGTTAYTSVLWGSYIEGRISTPFLRGFALDGGGSTLYCRRSGTYKIQWSARVSPLPALRSFVTRIQVARLGAAYPLNFYTNSTNSDGVNPAQVQIPGGPLVIDLQMGDTVTLGVLHDDPGSVTLAGSTTGAGFVEFNLTTLLIEEIDLPAPLT